MKRRYRTTDRLIWIRSTILTVSGILCVLIGVLIAFRIPAFIGLLVDSISPQIPGYQATNTVSLEQTVSRSLAGANGTYGIAIHHFKTGERYELKANRSFLAASTYKLWIMAMIYEKIEDGTLTEEKRLKADLETILATYEIAPEEAQQASGEISATVKDAIEKMITISDNNTALLLTDYIGQPRVNAYLERIGLRNSVGGNGMPTTTPADLLYFLEYLYQGKLANKTYTQTMIAVLQRQTLNTIIPKYLPKGTLVAHKTGARDGFSHDAALVYAPFGTYGIVIMSESGLPLDADERMAKLSNSVYTYFEKDIARRNTNSQIRSIVHNVVLGIFTVIGVIILVSVVKLIVRFRSGTKTQALVHTQHRQLRNRSPL